MNFKDMLLQAKGDKESTITEILERYKPLLLKESLHVGRLDEDWCQELCITLLNCIRNFKV